MDYRVICSRCGKEIRPVSIHGIVLETYDNSVVVYKTCNANVGRCPECGIPVHYGLGNPSHCLSDEEKMSLAVRIVNDLGNDSVAIVGGFNGHSRHTTALEVAAQLIDEVEKEGIVETSNLREVVGSLLGNGRK